MVTKLVPLYVLPVVACNVKNVVTHKVTLAGIASVLIQNDNQLKAVMSDEGKKVSTM